MNIATVDEFVTQGSVNLWTVLGEAAGVIALILSAVNFIHYYKSRKVDYTIQLVDYNIGLLSDIQKQKLRVTFEFVNNSQLPISITDLRLAVKGQYYSETKLPFEIYHYVHRIRQQEYPRFFYNEHLPLKLEALGSQQCHLVFLLPLDTIKSSETLLTFQIRTNRNTEHEFSISKQQCIHHQRAFLCFHSHNL